MSEIIEIKKLFEIFLDQDSSSTRYEVNNKQLAIDILLRYYAQHQDINLDDKPKFNEKIDEMVNFLLRNRLSQEFDHLLDTGFNPFQYNYKFYESSRGVNHISNFLQLILCREYLNKVNIDKLIDKFKPDITRITNDPEFFDSDKSFIYKTPFVIFFKFIELIINKDIIFGKLIDYIIKKVPYFLPSYLEKLYELYIKPSPDKFNLTFNDESIKILSTGRTRELGGCGSKINLSKIYNILIKFDSNFDFTKVKTKYTYFGYLKELRDKNVELENRVKALENALLYSPDNQDEDSPVKIAKSHFDQVSTEYEKK